jgi:hypothetical protein
MLDNALIKKKKKTLKEYATKLKVQETLVIMLEIWPKL